MYLDAAGSPVPMPDPTAGLYIRNRAGDLIKAPIPAGCIAFQMGETMQVASGGAVVYAHFPFRVYTLHVLFY